MNLFEDPNLLNLWLVSKFEGCLRDLMDGDEDLEVIGSEIPVAAEQMHLHFMTQLECAGLQIVPRSTEGD